MTSIHDPDLRLRGASDADVFAAALAMGRIVVTENASDFRALETEAIADRRSAPRFVFTTVPQFPRAGRRALGWLVTALDALLRGTDELTTSIFLRRPP